MSCTARIRSDDLSQPFYCAPIGVAVQRFWKKSGTFWGQASRSEYRWWVLVAGVVAVVLNILSVAGASPGSNGSGCSAVSAFVLILSIAWV